MGSDFAGPLVVLLGGNSDSGKSNAGVELAKALGFQYAAVDDFRLMLQRVATPEHLPAIFSFFHAIDSLDPASMAARYRDVANETSHALVIVVANHIAQAEPIVIEGDTLTPALAARQEFAGIPAEGRVRGVFLLENDEQQLCANVVARGRGVALRGEDRLMAHVRFSVLHAEWLATECSRIGVPVVEPRPFDSLLDRLVAHVRFTS